MKVASIKGLKEYNTGEVLLKLIDKVKPGLVDWSKVYPKPKNVFHTVINCNYGVDLCKHMKDVIVVGVDGEDFYKEHENLMKAVIW